MIKREEFYKLCTEFLNKLNDEIASKDVPADSNLFENGIIDSFGLTELLIFIQEITKKEIPFEQLSLKKVSSLSSLYSSFVSEE